MIYGIGTDIVDINRIKGLQNLGEFCKKLLSENELEIFKNLNQNEKIYYVAKQFARKESIAKALGSGFDYGLTPCKLEINRDKNGKPIVEIDLLPKHFQFKNIHISLSDEEHYVISFAVIEI